MVAEHQIKVRILCLYEPFARGCGTPRCCVKLAFFDNFILTVIQRGCQAKVSKFPKNFEFVLRYHQKQP